MSAELAEFGMSWWVLVTSLAFRSTCHDVRVAIHFKTLQQLRLGLWTPLVAGRS
jgi:hypothetical protein